MKQNAEMSGLKHNEGRQSLMWLLCAGPFHRFVLAAPISATQGKLIRETHLGLPAAPSAAGTKIIYYDINCAVSLLSFQIRTYFIEM